MVFLGGMDPKGEMESKDQPDPLGPQVLTVRGPSTPGGGSVPAHKWKALS